MFKLLRWFLRMKLLMSIAVPFLIIAMLMNFMNGQTMSVNNFLSRGSEIVKQIIQNIDFFNLDLYKREETGKEAVITEKGKVVKAVDGDTFYVRLADGKDYKVRLIGINCPEIGDNPEYYGEEAADFTKKQLFDKTVYLERDADDKDQYGRLLRYVYIEKPKDSSKGEIGNKMFNAILLKEGYGEIMKVQPNTKYHNIFIELQEEARESNKGIWEQ